MFTFLGSMTGDLAFSVAVLVRFDVIVWSVAVGFIIGTIFCWLVVGDAPKKVIDEPTGGGTTTDGTGDAPKKVIDEPTGGDGTTTGDD